MPRTQQPAVGQPLTWEEFQAMGETDEGYEVIEGRLQMSPRPSRSHQLVLANLLVALGDPATAAGYTVIPEVDWKLWEAPRLQVRAPDLIVVPGSDVETHRPVLAIEIVSPGNRGVDLVDKVEEYGAAGLAHYWVVDPEEPELIVYGREGDRLVERRPYLADAVVEETEPFPITFVVAALLP